MIKYIVTWFITTSLLVPCGSQFKSGKINNIPTQCYETRITPKIKGFKDRKKAIEFYKSIVKQEPLEDISDFKIGDFMASKVSSVSFDSIIKSRRIDLIQMKSKEQEGISQGRFLEMNPPQGGFIPNDFIVDSINVPISKRKP